jgi:dolichol-phosphate mannosyltransferase
MPSIEELQLDTPPQIEQSIRSTLVRNTAGPHVRIAVPAYNEAMALPLLVPRMVDCLEQTGWSYDIFVIDDGSSDDTAQVTKELSCDFPVRLVPHGVNRGLGAAITTCVTAAIVGLRDEDVVVTMDADNSHPPQLIVKMVPMIAEGRDIVIASRFQAGAQVVGLAYHRVVISQVASWVMRLVFGLRGCRDFTCGYRAYRVGKLRQAIEHFGDEIVTEQGFASMAELLLNVASCDAVIGEVPLVLRYDQKRGVSKMKLIATIRRTLRMIVRHRFRRKPQLSK